jgi:hypothetical protein
VTTLLVCGSRALARNPAAERWGRATIARAVAALPPGSTVVTGDARGPDRWAHDVVCGCWLARRPALWLRRFRPDGGVDVLPLVAGAVPDLRWTLEIAPAPDAGRAAWKARLLARDRAMVAWVAGTTIDGRVLALLDPASPTRGTEYTARTAEAAGLVVQREVWRGQDDRPGDRPGEAS